MRLKGFCRYWGNWHFFGRLHWSVELYEYLEAYGVNTPEMSFEFLINLLDGSIMRRDAIRLKHLW